MALMSFVGWCEIGEIALIGLKLIFEEMEKVRLNSEILNCPKWSKIVFGCKEKGTSS